MFLYKIALPCGLYKYFTFAYKDELRPGQFVICPLRGKPTLGMVIEKEHHYDGLVKNIETILPWLLQPKQLAFIKWLSDYTLTPLGMCLKLVLPFATAALEKLSCTTDIIDIGPLNNYKAAQLNADQEFCVSQIKEKLNQFSPFLLDGIMGSGKTEVYFDILFEILKNKQQGLVLLPEISLTQQWVKRFEERFGIKPLLWHSKVTLKHKRLIFNTLYAGEPCVVVGARSSLFLPFQNLKLIVVDEEHDASYKQEDQIIYNARDAAVSKAFIENCPIILASATPSLETYHNVHINRYQKLELTKRYTSTDLSPIHLIDQRKKVIKSDIRFISPTLSEAISEKLKAKEQTLLFVNRRGYAPLTLCNACGFRFDCSHCSSSLIFHAKQNKLKCHHCNHDEIFPVFCPGCGVKDDFIPCGPGVERLSEEAQKLFPEAKILQMSSDMFSSSTHIDEALAKILNNEVDIIIGTQIMAKGHNFPDLTLIGIIDADMSLSGVDLRACEKTFQLLFQLIGRAGRDQKQGVIYIQTHNPDHPVIQSLQNYQKENFLQAEYEQRKAFNMPPFSKLTTLTLTSPKQSDLLMACAKLVKNMPTHEGCQILGPSIPPMIKVRGRERRRFLMMSEKTVNRQKIIAEWVLRIKLPSSVRLSIDIDPYSFF
jgi:primosomal protein N' (replication factor Y)